MLAIAHSDGDKAWWEKGVAWNFRKTRWSFPKLCARGGTWDSKFRTLIPCIIRVAVVLRRLVSKEFGVHKRTGQKKFWRTFCNCMFRGPVKDQIRIEIVRKYEADKSRQGTSRERKNRLHGTKLFGKTARLQLIAVSFVWEWGVYMKHFYLPWGL